jgi:hypothetical protein
LCATSDLSGTGVRPRHDQTGPTWWDAHGARACGFPLVAGLITVEEVQAGSIDHALVIAYPHIRSGFYVPPASTAQAGNGTAVPTSGIPCGGRIQMDPTIDVDALAISDAGKMVLRALQTYGAYVGDFSGAISLYAENSPDAQAYWENNLDTYELQDVFEFDWLRVITIGTMIDNGNG